MLKLECVRVILWKNDKVLKNENMKNEINKICSNPNEYLFFFIKKQFARSSGSPSVVSFPLDP